MSGKVIYVEDGDTLTILEDDRNKTVVRLSDIDAPETTHGQDRPGQPFGQASRQSLASMAKGQAATATCYERDRWGRAVCTVFINGLDVNHEQLLRGMAWVNRLNAAYVRNPRSFNAEERARLAGAGIWSEARNAVPPWDWRHRNWDRK